MSLNQKYTWAQFLKEHPEHKTKKTKRTSAEGKKAFEAAFKKQAKEHLKDILEKIERQQKLATTKRNELTKKAQALVKAKKIPRVKIVQQQIGRQDAWLAKLGKLAERNKSLQKHF